MKRFENKVLYIRDEKMLEEVSEFLFSKGFEIDLHWNKKGYNYLYYSSRSEFIFGLKLEEDTELTYEEFINLLNAE